MPSADLGRSSKRYAWVEGKLQCNKYRDDNERNVVNLVNVRHRYYSIVGWVPRKILLVHDTPDGCFELPNASNEERYSIRRCYAPMSRQRLTFSPKF
jgi:hypothetical protein